MKPILEIKDLSKKYRIHGNVQPYLSLREAFFSFLKPSAKKEDFWALKDVNFTVNPGDSVGIIGKNGAGKSTLLKILSKITPPTSGSIISRGRIASLLEVGTGFHLELSGRENIYMNGSILGMKRADIVKKFDEIVDFAGVQKFIDTPLKHYSSGMQLRLAFAVAAFLEPEILIIDEVLAVGDAEFQKKCITKMEDINHGGRTILFVSHNMGTVMQLCNNCILLKDGQIVERGKPSDIIQSYYNNSAESYVGTDNTSKNIYIKKVETCSEAGILSANFAHSQTIHVRITIAINKYEDVQNIGLAMLRNDKKRVFTVNKALSNFAGNGDKEVCVELIIEGGLIAPMDYSFLIALNTKTGLITYDWAENICPIKVYDDGTEFAFAEGVDYGCIIIKDKWVKIEN
ncbi:MAG: polysaccharide ABC transporter ATP-binding protein [Bacteroidota bacterium]